MVDEIYYRYKISLKKKKHGAKQNWWDIIEQIIMQNEIIKKIISINE